MKKTPAARNLIGSIILTGILLYLMFKTPSPKIIFVPFLLCGLSLAGKSSAQLLKKGKWVTAFHKLFILGFLLFWFGFLAVAAYTCIRDKRYGMLLFTLPFWVIGFFVTKNKLLGIKGKPGKKNTASPFRFASVISAILVVIAIAAGIFLLVLGIQRKEPALLFGGVFFVLVSLAFPLGWLTISGKLEKAKVDVLGLYMGIVVAGIGIGILIWKFTELGLWMIVPILMIAAGLAAVIKSLKRRQ